MEGIWKSHEKNCYRAPANNYQNVCEICGKVFKDCRILRAHMKVHADERPYSVACVERRSKGSAI